jgi:hypothetical protein
MIIVDVFLEIASIVVALLGMSALLKNDETPQLLYAIGLLLFAIFLLLLGTQPRPF